MAVRVNVFVEGDVGDKEMYREEVQAFEKYLLDLGRDLGENVEPFSPYEIWFLTRYLQFRALIPPT